MRLSHPRRLCCAPFLCAATSCLPVSQPTCSYHLHLLGLYRPCCYQEVVPSSQQSGTSRQRCVAYYIGSSHKAQCLEKERARVSRAASKNGRCSLLHHAVPARVLHCFLQQWRAHHCHPANSPLPLSALRPSENHHFRRFCLSRCMQGQLHPGARISRFLPKRPVVSSIEVLPRVRRTPIVGGQHYN